MKCGSLVFDTTQGLGILAHEFYTHGVVTDVMVVEHGRRPSNRDWYPDAPRIGDLNSAENLRQMRAFVRSMDVMLFFETPFRWDLLADCKKSVLMVMHECMHEQLPALPDVFLCPSVLDYDCYENMRRCKTVQCSCGNVLVWDQQNEYRPRCWQCGATLKSEVVYLPVPVEVPWHRRERAEVFVHNAGNGGLRGRNGMAELLQAWRHVKSDAKLILRSQMHQDWPPYPELLDKVTLIEGTVDKSTLYDVGDVFIFPEKFNGLSLPLQEARAAGMLVMCGDRHPMNTWLLREPLIPVAGYNKVRIARHLREFDEAQFDPRTIAATIDLWYGKEISAYSDSGRQWAEENSWERLKPKYLEVLAP